MGMYTEYLIRAQLKKDAPREVRDILAFLCEDRETAYQHEVPDHPFFKTPRWEILGYGCSGYFPFDGGVRKCVSGTYGFRFLLFGNLKNYDGEIEKFVDWIRPYVKDYQQGGFLGYSMYEEAEEPTFYYVDPEKKGEDPNRWGWGV